MEESKFPYVSAYGKIPDLLEKILSAPEPTKLSHEMLQKVLGRKSSGDRPFIAFLKRLKFLDEENIPTQYYKDYRDGTKSKIVLGNCIKEVYGDVYTTHEKLHTLEKGGLIEKFKIVTGLGKDSQVLKNIVSSFQELVALADFKAKLKEEKSVYKPPQVNEEGEDFEMIKKLGFSYTINLNLPATTDQRVYNAIFKSLKDFLFK